VKREAPRMRSRFLISQIIELDSCSNRGLNLLELAMTNVDIPVRILTSPLSRHHGAARFYFEAEDPIHGVFNRMPALDVFFDLNPVRFNLD
jgi:hypothetical protein